MKKVCLAAMLTTALFACAPQTLQTEVVPAASFAPLEVPGRVYASSRQVMEHYLAAVGRSEPDEQELGAYSGSGGDRLLLFTAKNLEDDSIKEMQWRVVMAQTDIGLRVMSAGVRQQCRRSGSSEWTTTPCP